MQTESGSATNVHNREHVQSQDRSSESFVFHRPFPFRFSEIQRKKQSSRIDRFRTERAQNNNNRQLSVSRVQGLGIKIPGSALKV
jgi:hypothetical protein